jgi:nucleoside-diphosphate-sugar epimerase
VTSALAGARVLVTGASGFIGRHLVVALASEGAEVHGTSRADRDGGGTLKWWRCEPADFDGLRACFAQVRPDYVVHLSSLANGRRERELVVRTLRDETVAAVHVLEAAAECRARRLLLPASVEEPAPGEVPSSPYGAAKAASHLYARMYRRLYATPVVMARIFMAYGPGQPEWKLIPATALRMLHGEAARIESPDRRLDWIYISDVVSGLIAVLRAEPPPDDVIDLGSGELTTIRELVERLRRLTACPAAPAWGAGVARGNQREWRADPGRTAELTGWLPRVGLEEGLARTVAALRHERPAATPQIG